MTASKVWFIMMLLCGGLAIYFYANPIKVNQQQPQIQYVPVPAPAPQTIVQAPPPPRQIIANLEDFQVLKDGSTDNQWEVQLDARQIWKALPNIGVANGDRIEFTATGLVCGGVNIGCAPPNGQSGIAQASLTQPTEFAVGQALCQALVARIGTYTFQVGEHKVFVVPVGMGGNQLELMSNYRLPFIHLATGGFRVKVSINQQ